MAAIGFVNGTIDTGFVGQLKTLSIRAAIEIRTNRSKNGDVQPDYRVYSEGVEIGAGWIRVGQVSGEPYVSLSLAAPEFGPRRLYANLGRAAGQDGEDGYASQRWLTYRQAEAAGGNVRRGEKGTVICYADRFTPKAEAEAARGEDREARQVAFLKRFVVFNVDQCEGLPEGYTAPIVSPDPVLAISEADALIAASGATFQIGGAEAFYSPSHDFVQVPPQAAFQEPINWYRTALHELGHWTGHGSRLDRDQKGGFGSDSYAKEELVAEMASAFTCASLGIAPTVRHSDYIASWLSVLRGDEKAIFRSASQASRAADFLLAFAGAEQ